MLDKVSNEDVPDCIDTLYRLSTVLETGPLTLFQSQNNAIAENEQLHNLTNQILAETLGLMVSW